MAGGQAGQRQRLQVAALPQDGLAVFHPQDIVGAGQQRARAGFQFLGRGGAGRRKGRAARQMPLQPLGQGGAVHQAGSAHQQAGVGDLGAKGQRVAAQGGQQRHAGGGKALGAQAGIGGGQCRDQVRAGLQGRLHPHRFRQQREPAPLHGGRADTHGDASRAPRPQHLQLGGVPVVERVVLGNDARKFHKFFPFFPVFYGRKIKLFLENDLNPLYNKVV